MVGFMTLARSPAARATVVHFADEVLAQLDRLAAPEAPAREKA